jgi:hypothetical protein
MHHQLYAVEVVHMKRLLLGSVLSVFLAVGAARAEPLRQLPDIQLTSPQGATVRGAELAMPQQWLLIYLSGNEKNDRQLLALLQEVPDEVTDRVTVIVPGATPAALEALSEKNEKLLNTRWYSDTKRSAAKLLQLSGSATIMGLRASAINWTVGGSGKDSKVLRSLMSDWVQ